MGNKVKQIPQPPLAVTAEVAAAMLNCGRTGLYALLNAGEIATFRIGRRRLIEVQSLRAFIARKTAESERPADSEHARLINAGIARRCRRRTPDEAA